MFGNFIRFMLIGWSVLSIDQALAQQQSIKVGQATLTAYSTATTTTLTPFQDITFASPFPSGTTPNVFAMTPEFGSNASGGTGDDPCTIRIHSVTNVGFKAACLEPRNENRNSSSVTFDYIAIKDGQTDIPTTTPGESVTFSSQCEVVDHQRFGGTCSDCSLLPGQTNSFQTVPFPAASGGGALFTSAPVLLTQISSINNTLIASTDVPPTHPTGEPEFVDVSTNAITATGFDVAIARMEAGNGSISDDETICYLAVEAGSCKTLDLSSINGSSTTINFQAVIGGDVTRGHDNAPVVGASFETDCFTSTPVAVASMRRRNGGDGGFIRRVDLNEDDITLIIDEDRVSNNERGHITEPTSVLAFSGVFTTPVTLSYVRIKSHGRKIGFDWQTSAESFHLGFHLWGETSDGWVQLNKALIPGFGASTDQLKEYQKTIRLNRRQHGDIINFGISSVDTAGFEEFYGPFELDQTYGESDTSERIDWTETRRQFTRSMQAKGYTEVNGRWKKLTERRAKRLEKRQQRINASAVDVRFSGAGMRKISGAELIKIQPQWKGLDLDKLAVTLNGQGVERLVLSDDARLSDEDIVIVNVVAPQGNDNLYLSEYNYRLTRDRHRVRKPQHYEELDVDTAQYSSTVFAEKILTQDIKYLAAITSGSPWYDAQLFTTSGPVKTAYTAVIDQGIDETRPANLRIDLFGSIDLPGDQPDHHVQVSVNGHMVLDQWFDGLTQFKTELELLPGLVNPGDNEIAVTVMGDTGLAGDIVLIDEISLLVPTDLKETTAYDFLADPSVGGYLVKEIDASLDKRVFAYSSKGGFSTINAHKDSNSLSFAALPFLNSQLNDTQLRYTVATTQELESAVSLELVNADVNAASANPLASADLMIVAHPNFIGEDLDSYIKYKRDLGLEVQLLNWLDLVATYGFGNNTPQSLDNYLATLDATLQPSHLLLVGGHTYDYRNLLGQNAISFIPAHYRRVSIFEYTQSDNVFADLDGDNLPEIAIGRWPVRTVADLRAIVAKSIDWQEMNINGRVPENALLIAQSNDGRNLDFDDSLEGHVAPNIAIESESLDIERVYLGQLNSLGVTSPIAQARETITNAINDGTRLVSFAGHASTAGWGFQGIVNTALISQLENDDSPTIVMPLACYTTDYQSLTTNTLAHQWLFSGNHGAAAVHGATSLGQYRENGVFAERVLKASVSASSLGTAIQQAKRRMSSRNETLHNWALLGDPSLPTP